MLFNSISFLLFFPIVSLLYWGIIPKYRNIFLLLASYYFYMSWEPTYAILIIFTSLSTWACAIFADKTVRYKRAIITSCILTNLLILYLFKYFNFSIDIISSIFCLSGIRINIPYSHYLLPVGISFYTFQCIGYIVDVYRKEIKPERNFINYAVFVSFFPQLVAGPIERATNLLPQFHTKHIFNGDTFID